MNDLVYDKSDKIFAWLLKSTNPQFFVRYLDIHTPPPTFYYQEDLVNRRQ